MRKQGTVGVERAILGDDYLAMLPEFRLVDRGIFPFGYRTVDRFPLRTVAAEAQGEVNRAGMRVAIVNYGMGNLASVHRALEDLGEDVFIADRPDAMAGAGRLILPRGSGLFKMPWAP